MPQVIEVIRRLFPEGTNPFLPQQQPTWDIFPNWPPDAFAIAATLVNSAGSYCRPRYAGGIDEGLYSPEAVHFSKLYGPRWARMPPPEDLPELQDLWEVIYSSENGEVADPEHARCQLWWDAAFKLLLAADEASAGAGFVVDPDLSPLADFILDEYQLAEDDTERRLRHIPLSICLQVPPEELCVQPKARTTQFGCTLRSLTHHLALLPSRGDVRTRWHFGFDAERQGDRDMNLLLVPFPYRLATDSFQPGGLVYRKTLKRLAYHEWESAGKPEGEAERFWAEAQKIIDSEAHFFYMRQTWLNGDGGELSADQISLFLRGLVRQAEREGQLVNGIVLPELALDERRAKHVANLLADISSLELFISGIATSVPGHEPIAKNEVYTRVYSNHGFLADWTQSKHHRWKLDGPQIERYNLATQLNPRLRWWEGINVEERACVFYVFRPGACLVSLVCEDLARIDPVQTVIRAVGPNLVIALLMDGPQLMTRWPSRYATVLADDPGSSVLTVTSLGLMRRSWKGERIDSRQAGLQDGKREPREIALWKDSSGGTHELWLPAGSHGLLLTLRFEMETNFTLDGRSDDGCTARVALLAVHAITHPQSSPLLD